jgi:hypothetical protein
MTVELRAICPECDSITQSGKQIPKYYVNVEKEVGFCFHCGFSGPVKEEELETLNVVDIKERLPFDPTSFNELPTALPPEAVGFLNKRFPGVSLDELTPYSLRYHPRYHALAIPTTNPETGELQGVKYRFISPVSDLRYISEEASQFGGYWLEGKQDKLLITEGELDAITAKLLGFEGTVLALQTNRMSQETAARIPKFKNVFFCLDNDKAGLEGRTQVTALLRGAEPSTIVLPGSVKDLNELLQEHGREESSHIIRKATRTDLERNTVSLSESVSELVEFLSDRRNTKGDSTGWGALDHAFGGGLRPAEMTVLNSFAKQGKTTFLNNLAHNLALVGKRVAIASFEMDPAKTLYPSLLSIAGQTNIRSITDRTGLQEAVELIESECSYLNNIITLRQFGYTPWEQIEEWAYLMRDQYQIEYLFLDHAGFLVEKMTDAEENQILSKNISKLCKSSGLHIPVVVQAPKTKDGLSIQTAYGGLAWAMHADNFLIIERDKQNEMALKVRLEAARYPGAVSGGDPVLLFYDRETGSLSE